MKVAEFISLDNYITLMESEKKPSDKREQRLTGMFRNSEFFSLIPLILEKYPNIRIRDMLEVDATFSVVFPKGEGPDFISAISLYQDVKDICGYTMYTKVQNTGLIDLDSHEGFWVLLAS